MIMMSHWCEMTALARIFSAQRPFNSNIKSQLDPIFGSNLFFFFFKRQTLKNEENVSEYLVISNNKYANMFLYRKVLTLNNFFC